MEELKYTVAQIAEKLEIDKSKVYILCKSGELNATNISTGKVKARWRISESDLQSFLEKRHN